VKTADAAKKKVAGKQVDANVKAKLTKKGQPDAKVVKTAAKAKLAKAKVPKEQANPEKVAKKQGDQKAAAAAKVAKADPKPKAQDTTKKRHGARGEVKAIDVAAKMITLSVRKAKKQFEDKTVSVADNVKVRINGETKTLADVQVGAKVNVRLSEDEKTAVAINIGGGKKKPQPQ
jgi:hypothetical protein